MSPEVLDFTHLPIESYTQESKYVATPEEHQANVQAAIALGYPSLDRGVATMEPIAVVCSGPSLKTTYREIKHFDKIITCSGAHRFLLDHGIVPTWHMEGDPRAHKAVFVKHPHRRVQYLIASACHPKVFQALKGHQIKLWHVLMSGKDLVSLGHYPPGQWVLTGGANIGMRAMVMARVLGYLDIHIFGMDCSAGEETFHTGDHPNNPARDKWIPVQVGEQMFYSTPLWVAYARQFFHEVLQLPDSEITLHGDGLLQALAKAKLADPDQYDAWMAQREAIDQTTIAVVERPPGPLPDVTQLVLD